MVTLGLNPLCVGDYTPWEIVLISKQKTRESDSEVDKIISLAWHTEAFARCKRLPKLKKVLSDIHKGEDVTNRGDLVLKAMAAEKGVKV